MDYNIGTESVTAFSCQCPIGQSKCSHMAAILIYCNRNISKTDITCQWIYKKKNNNNSAAVKSIDEMYHNTYDPCENGK